MKINHDSAKLLNMFHKDVERMENFKGWTDEDIKSIKAPAFIVIGDHDIVTPEHAAKMYRLIPDCRLAILPGAHGEYLGEALFSGQKTPVSGFFVAMVNEFLQTSN